VSSVLFKLIQAPQLFRNTHLSNE